MTKKLVRREAERRKRVAERRKNMPLRDLLPAPKLETWLPGLQDAQSRAVVMAISYTEALRMVLNVRTLTRPELLSYFAEAEHGSVGRWLDEMVREGVVDSMGAGKEGPRYRLASS